MPLHILVGSLALVGCAASAGAQQQRFDDVIRNLRNPDARVRLAAVQLLHESKYPEAIGPIAALVTDPVDQIQLEAISAEPHALEIAEMEMPPEIEEGDGTVEEVAEVQAPLFRVE